MRLLLCLLLAWGLRAETVLVIPFFNESGATNLDWIGESVAETVRESLDAQGLLALDREARLEAFRRLSLRPNAVLTLASVIKAAQALDASDVVFGRYEFTAGPPAAGGGAQGVLSISGRLLNLKRLKQEPEFTETGPLEDLAALEARLSWRALESLSPKTAPSEEDFLRTRPHVRLDALEHYIRGLLATDPEQRSRLFLQAARLDENYSQPCFQLGKWYWAKKDYRAAAGWLERVRAGDARYLEARFFLGLCRYQTGDFAAAAKCFETVAATVPLNEVYNDWGVAQVRAGDAAAADNFRKAIEGDASDPDYHFNLAYALWKSGQWAAAADSFRAVLTRNPDDAEAANLLARAERHQPFQSGDEGRERLKHTYEEAAFRQLKAELDARKH